MALGYMGHVNILCVYRDVCVCGGGGFMNNSHQMCWSLMDHHERKSSSPCICVYLLYS